MFAMPTSHKVAIAVTGAALASVVHFTHIPDARACGCVAPPDPTTPVVQNAERIAFAMENGVVVAHIQIQYEGDAEEFAWLVPVPSLPSLDVGTDELFTQLIQQTQPIYVMNREYDGNCAFDPSRGGFPSAENGADDSGNPPSAPPPDPDSPLVVRATTGPYDYAVLSARDKQAMLDWLAQERFFVPAGTDTVVDPYINPNSYFLALKLRPGAGVGDLQPIVVRYQSNLPMIPIILTSVAANPDMGIMVWVLGPSRAIPRNYFHTIVNDAAIDWLNNGANYVDVVTRAVDESDGNHSFVTEYAGTSSIMLDLLDPEWRFGDLGQLALITDAQQYIEYLLNNGFTVLNPSGPFFIPAFSSQVLSILEAELPMPSGLATIGITPNDYYTNISYYLTWHRQEYPDLYTDLDLEFDPAALTAELDQRVVQPTLDAGRLFRDNPYMTRLFTTLSPHEMNRDPVFSFNEHQLPDVSRRHEATLTYFCGMYSEDPATTPARLVTEQGWVLDMPQGTGDSNWSNADMPASQFTQILREEGAAQNVLDNSVAIDSAIDKLRPSTGCSITGAGDARSRGGAGVLVLFAALGLLLARRRRWQSVR